MNTKYKKQKTNYIFFFIIGLCLIIFSLLIITLPKKGMEEISAEVKTKKQDIKEIQKKTTQVQEKEKNAPPEINILKFKYENLGSQNTLFAIVEASDKNNDPITYIYEWKKDGEIISKEDKITNFKRGDKITLSVTPFDGIDYGIIKSIDIDIANSPPIINEHNKITMEGDLIKYQVEAFDPDGDQLIFSFIEAPPNAKIDEKTGLVEFKPTSNKMENFNVKVSDQQGGEVTYSFELGFGETEGES